MIDDNDLHEKDEAVRSGDDVADSSALPGKAAAVEPSPVVGSGPCSGRPNGSQKSTVDDDLRRAKEEWERTFDSVPDLIAIMDNSHRIVRINRAMAERLGVSPEHCVGKNCYQSVHGTDKPPDFCPHAMTLDDGLEHMAELHGDNLCGDFLVTTSPLLDENGRSIGSVHVARDITERKRAEEALQESERRFRTLLVNIPGAAYRCEIAPPWRVSFMSDGVEAITGHPSSEFLRPDGVVWGDLVLPEDMPGVEMAVEAGLASKAPYEMEYRIRHADGGIRWVFEQGRAIYDAKGRPNFLDGVIVNITERKSAEAALESAKEAAEAANRAKSLFLANMSHELRTPMTGVLGMLEIARSGPLDERQREAVDTAYMSGRSLLMILNDILDLARIEAGKLVIDEKPFSLRECLSGAVNILMPEARRKGIGLSWSLAADAPETVIGDRLRLQQVLTNLAGNAVKFTEKGKVDVTVRIGGETGDGKREFIFDVVDTGIGIPADKMEIIFQSFCQIDNSHSRRYGGTGLGLAISRDIVELMGGSISCESREGEGSTFTFTVPMAEAGLSAAPPPEPASSLPMEEAVHRNNPLKGKRLLVAEDDEVTRNVLGFMLQKSGYDFDFATNGMQVIEMWEKGGYDLIVMDGQMPGMDGFEATRTIRERERKRGGHIPVVAMTAHALKEDRDRCLAAGMDDYVSKPIDFGRCLEVIRGLLCNCGREDEKGNR